MCFCMFDVLLCFVLVLCCVCVACWFMIRGCCMCVCFLVRVRVFLCVWCVGFTLSSTICVRVHLNVLFCFVFV